jgi:tRNA pseudouridine55 synthase
MRFCGILNVNKPGEWTSRGVVDRVERIARLAAGESPLRARAGHAGTLDPLATGVLVVCVGQATRLIQYVQQMPKQYRATFLLGHRSPTDDVEGEVALVDGAPQPTRAAIEAVLPLFLGYIEQRPPEHSAIKVGGQRAYDRARQGESFALPSRTVTVHRLTVTRYHYPELALEIECGSGTYVRALGRDLAASLGTAAVMSALERTAVGPFRVEDAVPIDEVDVDSLAGHLHPPLAAASQLPRVELSDDDLNELGFGRSIEIRSCATGSASAEQTCRESSRSTGEASVTLAASAVHWAGVDPRGQLASILYEKHPGQLWPVRNFQLSKSPALRSCTD